MIDQLVQYARDQGLAAEPGFATKTVKWAVALDASGKFLDVPPLGDTSQRNNPGQTFARCPEMGQPELVALGATRGAGAHFLVETAQVVALFLKPGTAPEDAGKAQGKHDCFVSLLREAGTVMPELTTAADALSDETTLEAIRHRLTELRAKPTDKVTLRIDRRYPVESDAWHDWWRAFRAGIRPANQDGPKMVCLATGEPVTPVATHPKITGLADVGGLAMGSPLVGYDKDAFPSYGLKKSENGAMSEEAAFAYRGALNQLLRAHSRKLAGARVTHWYQCRVQEADDPLAWLDTPPDNEEEAAAAREAEVSAAQHRADNLLRALHAGERPDLRENRYYALTLSGAGGRVMVRDWMEGSFEELVENVRAWFDDLSIVRRDGTGLTAPPKFLAVMASLARDLNDVPAPSVTEMWRAAVRHLPIPGQFMAQTLARVKIALIRDDPVSHAGMGLLKAYHVRKGGNMEPYLNEEHPEAAYHCGRLLAVLARLQNAALGDVGAGVVQRYYAAASATPALVLGRLIRTSQFHLGKIDNPRLAYWYESQLASIWGRIEDRVPSVLSLEQQSLFALGYYQQIAANRAPRATANTADEKENNNA